MRYKTPRRMNLKILSKTSVRQKASIYLNELKQSYSKATDLSYSEFELQPYLKTESNISIHEKCCKSEETQVHILTCSVLNENSALPASDSTYALMVLMVQILTKWQE